MFPLSPTYLHHTPMLALPLFCMSSILAAWTFLCHTTLHFFQFPHDVISPYPYLRSPPPTVPCKYLNCSPFPILPQIMFTVCQYTFFTYSNLHSIHCVLAYRLSFHSLPVLFSRTLVDILSYHLPCLQTRPHRLQTYFLTFSINMNITILKKNGLSAEPWCSPTSTLKLLLSAAKLRTLVLQYRYISCITLIWYRICTENVSMSS